MLLCFSQLAYRLLKAEKVRSFNSKNKMCLLGENLGNVWQSQMDEEIDHMVIL